MGSLRPLGSQGEPRDILSGVAECPGHSSHQRSLPRTGNVSGFLCPHPLYPDAAQLGFGRWGEPGPCPAPKNRQELSHPHPRTRTLPLNAPGWREMPGQPVKLHVSQSPRRCCLFQDIRTGALKPSRSGHTSLPHSSPSLGLSSSDMTGCQLSKGPFCAKGPLCVRLPNRISRPPTLKATASPSGAL